MSLLIPSERKTNMKLNKSNAGSQAYTPTSKRTHEGAPAAKISNYLELRRSVLATMLWEDSFYESGQEISQRILGLIPNVPAKQVAQLAIETRSKGKLRHVPLLIARAMAKVETHKPYVAQTLAQIIQRPDELSEFLAIYWKEKKQPLSNQVKKGLATAFGKFDEYQLAKYNRDNAIKLKDVLFLTHPKPQNKDQEKLWKKLIGGYCAKCWKKQNEHTNARHEFVEATLTTPDTWEVALSEAGQTGASKKDEWERLLKENKLGGLALIRNLRNFKEAGVSESLVRDALKNMKVERVLPYRFVTAARYAPNLEPELEEAMFKAIESKEKLNGKTVLLIDVSGSMDEKISAKSESKRIDAATGLAILAREMFKDVEVFTFSNSVVQVPTRRGFALRDAIVNSQAHGGTYLGKAIEEVNRKVNYDRLIVFTDEQSADRPSAPKNGSKGYVINVAANQNGVGYGAWNHIDGFSEAVLDYIVELEKLNDE